MTFEPGKYYYYLSSEEYETLIEFMASFEGDDFLSDFTQVGDYWFAISSSIDEEEYDYLVECGLAHYEKYTKSVQSNSFFD